MRLSTALAASCLSWLLFSGCGPGLKTPSDDASLHRPVLGEIGKELSQLQGSKWLEPCDDRFKDQAQEIADDLDRRADQIVAYAKALPPNKKFQRVALGPAFVRKPLEFKPGKGLWSEYETGWEDLYSYYQKIKDQTDMKYWFALDSEVRFHLSDEQSRLIDLADMFLDKDSQKPLEKLLADLKVCISDSTCGDPKFGYESSDYFYRNPLYSEFRDNWTKADKFARKRTLIEKLGKWVESDLRRYQMRHNSSIHRDGDKLMLPLDPGAFVGAESELAGYIEPVWTNEKLKLQIDWKSAEGSTDVFKVIFEDAPGGRSYVAYANREVHLFSDIGVRSIAHEIGHVLGFKDHYYTIWQPLTCRYRTQSNDGDLMSSSSSGIVTDEEWKILDQTYPAAAASLN